MTVLLLAAALPVWLVSYATQYWQLLAIGLLLGVVGASFAVGTPYCARFFPQEKRGFAMGFFGAGTTGAALNMFVAPRLIEAYGWTAVPKVYAVVLLATRVATNHKAQFDYDDGLVEAVLARCTEVDTGARAVDHILNGTLLPEIAESVLARMAEGQAIARIKVGAGKDGKFKYSVK